MTKLESIEKLRELVCDINAGEIIDHIETYPRWSIDGLWLDSWHMEFDRLVDDIQAEIDFRFMELPVDADGVPIRFGDMVCELHRPVAVEVMSFTYYSDCVDVNACGMNPNMLVHVKPRTVEDAMAEYAEISTSEDVKKYNDLSDELRKIQYEQFRDKPEHEFYKELNGYEFYIELPYDELCIGHEKAWVNHHSYSYMYKKPDGGTVYSCSSLCGYSRDWAIERIENEIGRIEREHGDVE